MKKKLEAELMSLAHRVLKLKGREDLEKLYEESKLLHEKIAILKFYEDNRAYLNGEVDEIRVENAIDQLSLNKQVAFDEANESLQENHIEAIVSEVVTIETPIIEQIPIVEKVNKVEEPIRIDNKLPEPELEIEEPVVSISNEEEKPVKQISLEDFLSSAIEPEFVKKSEEEKKEAQTSFFGFAPDPVEVKEVESNNSAAIPLNFEHVSTPLNEKLLQGINIGLNDRIAFVNHLFGGDDADYNRVLSQLNSLESLSEARKFIEEMVRPDYNNWVGKEEYVERFYSNVEKKFI